MIVKRQHFDLNGKVIIEKLILKSPFSHSAVFQKEACFLYFKDAQVQLKNAVSFFQTESNDAVLLNCGNYFADFVQNISSTECEVIAIHLYPTILKDIFQTDFPQSLTQIHSKSTIKSISNQSIFEHFIAGLSFYFENPSLMNSEILIVKVKELILLLLQTESALTLEKLFLKLFSTRAIDLQEMIETHLFSNLSVEDLAFLSARSLSTFKREFQTIYNCTPAKYILSKKLEKAQQLLLISDLNISEICFESGFNDVSHFSKKFKDLFKLSPAEYRIQQRLKK